ncbi:MAG: DNA primase [Oscillospiraceae bacterium]|nr:DNA primase [Oscillospiraceae bacterium]
MCHSSTGGDRTAFPDTFINELVARNDIVDVVSGYVRLGKKSGSNMFGLCPFHSEKTPSFSVSPDKQIYHCFGCGKGGGVISFIMEIENLSFPEAVAFLAKRANMTLPEQEDDRESKKRSRMYALNKEAARFFYEQLLSPAGAQAREYMAQRGISKATATNFGLGCAPNAWDALEKAMREKGYTDFELFDAGLVKKGRNGGWYDTFRDRLMFPVIDVQGRVIGFSGRILTGEGPKYLNSPETLVFNKGRNLFALNLAKKSKSGYILLSEGNIDVVSLHQAGFDSAVASLGTSLTAEQARLISRYTDQVIIAYDNDGAGQKAAQRAIAILEKLELKVRVLQMSGAKDPDEFIKLKGPEAFAQLIEGSENQTEYRLAQIAKKYDLSVDAQKLDYLREVEDLLARRPSAAEREIYCRRIAAQVSISPEVLIGEVANRRKRILRQTAAAEGRGSPTRLSQPASGSERPLRYDDPASAVAEEGVIRLLYLEPELIKSDRLPAAEEFSSPALGHIYSVLRTRLAEGKTVSADVLGGELEAKEVSLLVSILQKPEALSNAEKALDDYINRIRDRRRARERGRDPMQIYQQRKEELEKHT